tara:strand:- start:85 stop:501 length:417 start_codon:yes stop_codon:yes gene_type:complete
MDGVTLTPLKQIKHPKGDIFHAMKKSDDGFSGFGEAYFSAIEQGVQKGWKKHTKMTMNIIVPIGAIEFVIYSENLSEFVEINLSVTNYQRLTVRPGLWVSFKGVERNNILLNIASLEHEVGEAINLSLDSINHYGGKK